MKHQNLKIAAILIGLALVFGLFAAPVQAQTYGLSLATKDGSGNAKAEFIRGQKLYLHIIATELQGIAGCAFTLNYDSTILTAPVTDADGVAATGIISLFPFTFVKEGHADNGAVTMRENSSTAGKILFSGASIDTSTGGAKYTASTPGGAAPLFIVEFTVKADAPFAAGYAFSLVQTVLNNTAAGYPAEGAGVPLLVGAAPQSDAANWANLTSGAFPILLATLGTTTATFGVVDVPLYTTGGTVAYTPTTGHAKGYQSGNLVIAAFATTDTGYTTPMGGQSMTWPQGTESKTFTLSVPDGNYYLRAFIDTNGNNTMDEWEARGAYTSNVIAISGANDSTSRAFSMADPIDGTSGEPKFYVKWKTDHGWTAIGSMMNDYDRDGYSNIQEYINRKANPSLFNPADTTNLDAQGGTGYNTSTDSRVAALAPWTPITGQQYNMVVYGTAYDGAQVATTGDWIGAFGPGGLTDCRSVAQIGAGGSYYLTIVGSTNNQKISFKLKRASDSKTFDAWETITFVSDTTIEDKVLHFSEARRQTIDLITDWNWVSFNNLPPDTSFASFFGDKESLVLQVKTQTASATHTSSGWQGDSTILTNIANGAMFKIKTSAGFTLNVDGLPVDPAKSISLNNNWTWIAYLPNTSATVETNLAGVLEILLQIKSQTQSKTKSGVNFVGDLVNMEPGKGYMIKTNTTGALVYPGQ